MHICLKIIHGKVHNNFTVTTFMQLSHWLCKLFTKPVGKLPIMTVCLVQRLKKLRPAVFKQLLAIDIFFRLDSVHIGCGILPKIPWHRPRFLSSRWSEVISGTESDAMLVWITTERESHEK